jgi:hypothetical protein
MEISISEPKTKIFYGIQGKYIDVTDKCYTRCNNDGVVTIPVTDMARARIFGDPTPGIEKHILVEAGDDIYITFNILQMRKLH